MAKVGRPRKINETIRVTAQGGQTRETTRGDYLIELLAMGRSEKNAADLAGIGHTTVREWLARGEEGATDRDQDDEFAIFTARAREAQAQGRAIHERSVVLAGVPRPVTTTRRGFRDVMAPDGQVRRVEYEETSTREEFDWRANAWALVHIYGVTPPPSQVELSGPDGGPIDVRAEAQLLLARLDGFLEGRAEGLAEGAVIEIEAHVSE